MTKTMNVNKNFGQHKNPRTKVNRIERCVAAVT